MTGSAIKDSQSSYKGEFDLRKFDQPQRVAGIVNKNIWGDLDKITPAICLESVPGTCCGPSTSQRASE